MLEIGFRTTIRVLSRSSNARTPRRGNFLGGTRLSSPRWRGRCRQTPNFFACSATISYRLRGNRGTTCCLLREKQRRLGEAPSRGARLWVYLCNEPNPSVASSPAIGSPLVHGRIGIARRQWCDIKPKFERLQNGNGFVFPVIDKELSRLHDFYWCLRQHCSPALQTHDELAKNGDVCVAIP